VIQAIYIARCSECGVYPAPGSSPRKTLEEIALASTGNTEHAAVAHAVRKGWSAYPLICPACARTLKEALTR